MANNAASQAETPQHGEMTFRGRVMNMERKLAAATRYAHTILWLAQLAEYGPATSYADAEAVCVVADAMIHRAIHTARTEFPSCHSLQQPSAKCAIAV